MTDREAAVGVRSTSYLLSKGVVLGALTGVQTIVFALIVLVLRPLHEPVGTVAVVAALLVLTTWAGVGMALVVSALARSEDQAVSFVPLLLIPQLLFGGSVMPVHQMGVVIKAISKVVIAQWSFAGLGNAIHMNARIHADPPYARGDSFGHVFFAFPAAAAAAVIVGFIAICAVLLHGILARRAT